MAKADSIYPATGRDALEEREKSLASARQEIDALASAGEEMDALTAPTEMSDPMGLMTPTSSPEDAPPMPKPEPRGRLKALRRNDPARFDMFMNAAGGDAEAANELLTKQLRKERGLDRETRRAARDDQQRALAARSILRRNAGDPDKLRRALSNFNRNNPQNPMRPEDLGLSGATDPTTARPGDVVRVGSSRNVDPRRVAPGAILDTDTGMRRVDQIGDRKIEVPVQRDAATGHFFPDPDRYDTQEAFDAKIRRQDRVNLRQSVMRSNDPVLANEQRRLDAAREVAANSIPEIRDAGLRQVAEQERALHWRYISEKASLGGVDIGQIPEEREIDGPPEVEGPTIEDVERLADSLAQRRVAEMRRQGITMTPERVAAVERAARLDAQRRAGTVNQQFDPNVGIGDPSPYPEYEPDPISMEPDFVSKTDVANLADRFEAAILKDMKGPMVEDPEGLTDEMIEGPLTPAQRRQAREEAMRMARERFRGSNVPADLGEPEPVSEMDANVAADPAPQRQSPAPPAGEELTPDTLDMVKALEELMNREGQ